MRNRAIKSFSICICQIFIIYFIFFLFLCVNRICSALSNGFNFLIIYGGTFFHSGKYSIPILDVDHQLNGNSSLGTVGLYFHVPFTPPDIIPPVPRSPNNMFLCFFSSIVFASAFVFSFIVNNVCKDFLFLSLNSGFSFTGYITGLYPLYRISRVSSLASKYCVVGTLGSDLKS